MKDERLWNRTFTCVWMISALTAIVYYLLNTTLVNYTMSSFGAAASVAGLCVGGYALGAMMTRICMGKMMTSMGKKRMAWFGTIGYAVVMWLYLAAKSLPVLIFLRFLHGAMYGISNTSANTIAMERVPESKTGSASAMLTMSPAIATALGPLFGVLLIERYSYTVILICCAVTATISAGMVFIADMPKDVIIRAAANAEKKGIHLRDFLEPSSVPVGFALMLCCMCYSTNISFINTFASEIGLAEAAALFFTVYAIAMLISKPFAGKLQDKKGDNALVFPALIIYMAGIYCLGSASAPIMLWLAAVGFALGFSNYQSAGYAVAVKMADKDRVGMATTTYWLFADIGVGLGPTIAGAMIPVLGYRGMYKSLVLFVVVSFIVYLVFHGRRPEATEPYDRD